MPAAAVASENDDNSEIETGHVKGEARAPPLPPPAGEPPHEHEAPAPAVVELGPEPEPEVPGDRDFKGNRSWPVPGGWIVHHAARDSLDAHCSCEAHLDKKNPCRLNRTHVACARGLNQARGRPLGLLMAWLKASSRHASRRKHHGMVSSDDPEDVDLLSFDRRVAGRAWLVQNGYDELLALERRLRAGELDEPDGWA